MADNITVLPDLNSGPRNFITTEDDHGGIAIVICTLMATWCVLCWIVRLWMRATVSGPFGTDDIVATIATIFAVIQMIVSCIAIMYGFGKSTVLLSAANVINAEKALYAAQLLYIVTNALAKATVALLLARIVFIKSRVYVCYGVLVLSALWGVGALLALAIRCTEYPPWQIIGDQCPNLLAEWKTITALNIIIEVALFAVPVWLVWNLQTDFGRKCTVVSVFALRLPVIAAAVARIHYLSAATHSDQVLLAGVESFICLNIEMHYAVMSATFPTLKPFVAAFNTSWGTYDSQGVSGYGSHRSGQGSYAMGSLPAGDSRRANSLPFINTGSHNNSHTRSADRESRISSYGKNVTHIRSNANQKSPKSDHVERSNSQSSNDSKQMIIRQTMTCEVHYEDEERKRNGSMYEDSIDFASPAHAGSAPASRHR